MKMPRACFSVLALAVLVGAVSCAVPRQGDQESLKSALEAVTRKQRSLDFVPQDYYNELRSFKFHPEDGPDDKFERQPNQELDDDDDDDEDLEFLPLDNGQLENIGGGYQNFNNKRLERALINYLENPTSQRESAPSPFRERERTGGHKRGIMNERVPASNNGNQELAALFYKELQNGPSYNTIGDLDEQDFLPSDNLQSYYDRYRAKQGKLERNKLYESAPGAMPWGEIFGKQDAARKQEEEEGGELRDHDPETAYLLPAERRNVNGRYPLGREYGVFLKRYPLLTKRSPKPLQNERQNAGVITDPKVAKDLRALFGCQSTDPKHNHTHDHRDKAQQHADHEKEGSSNASGGEHVHSLDHEHDHSEEHADHDHDHKKHATPFSEAPGVEATSSEALRAPNSPQTTDNPGQKEVSNGANKVGKLLSKRDHRTIDKKSVDWSQYFGIDRRKKKVPLIAKPGTEDQDDEWMLQQYYKTMAENLKSNGKSEALESGEKHERLDQMDSRLNKLKNLLFEVSMKYGMDGGLQDMSKDDPDTQEARVMTLMSRLAAALSLRRSLNELRSTIAARNERMRAAEEANNTSGYFRGESKPNGNKMENRNRERSLNDDTNSNSNTNLKKRLFRDSTRREQEREEVIDEGRDCPMMERIASRCRPIKSSHYPELFEPCVSMHVCRACAAEAKCCTVFFDAAVKVCDDLSRSDGTYNKCILTTLMMWRNQPAPIESAVCRSSPENCLLREFRYRHRGLSKQVNACQHQNPVEGAQLTKR